MDGQKISFTFMKTKKVEKPVIEDQKDYIECVEEKSIKVVGGEPVQEDKPLVIPMKPNTLMTTERMKAIAEKVEALDEPEEIKQETEMKIEEKASENETLDQMAIRELLQDAKKKVKVEGPALTVPIPAKPVMDGQKESTLDDYEAVPVQDFGMAMLRGMGWTAGKESQYKPPQLRPKGLGLGADKVVKENQKNKSTKDKEEELSIVKNSFVKITTGKYSGFYGKVVSLDEDNGRVMVEIPVKKETVSLSEFMMQPVTKSEYDKESKVLNADTYEEYKKNEKSQKSSKNDSPKVTEREASSSQRHSDLSKDRERDRREDNHRRDNSSNGRSKDRHQRHRRDSSSSEERSKQRKKEKKKYANKDASSSSDTEKKKRHKSRRRHSTSESQDSDSKKERRRKSPAPEGKRDIDKKRKGKKKKRDRDRSPNYRKHRK